MKTPTLGQDAESPGSHKTNKHDMDVAEQNVLAAEQLVKNMCDSGTFATVTPKQVDNIYEKLKNIA